MSLRYNPAMTVQRAMNLWIYLQKVPSAIMNTGVLLKNYKMYVKRNWSQSKDGTDMFEGDKNVNAKKNNRTIVDSDDDSNNI